MIHRLHLEITSKCALKCPACVRTEYNEELTVKDMPVAVVKNILSSSQKFTTILLCGDHGDPIYHSDFHEILPLLQQIQGAPPIEIATNGSHRDTAWWEKTAALLRPQDSVIFGIDGLANSNHRYRRGASWPSIENAVKTLKAKGSCRVLWQWILFKYNENQLREARKVAESWGIDRFFVIKTYRTQIEELNTEKNLAEAIREFSEN